VAVRRTAIEVDHTRRRQWLRLRDCVGMTIRSRYAGADQVTCIIPGHDRPGEELVADELFVEDGPLRFSFRGRCGYGSSSDYAG
jgi:hypothetical protein